MKVAFLSKYSGISNRGAETYVQELSTRLKELNLDVQVCPALSGNPDVVIPVNGRLQAIEASIWAKTHGAKVIISGQSGPGWDDRLNLFTFPNTFVALTDFQQQWAKTANPLVKTVVIPNGVDLQKFNPSVKSINIDLPHPIVLCVAALEPIKRQELLIRAVSKTKASLLLVGKGSLEPKLKYLCDQLLPGRYAIKSYSFADMPHVYTACDIFVYPTSPWESFGIAMLEAMASGLPVVATDDPIRREIAGPDSVYVNPGEIDSFAQALLSDLKKPSLRYIQNFSWDVIADKYLNLINNL